MKWVLAALLMIVAAVEGTDFATPHGNLQQAWKFNGTYIAVGAWCLIYRITESPATSSVISSVGSENSATCNWEGMVSPVDEHFYLFQLNSVEQVLRIIDVGHVDQVGLQTVVVRGTFTGYTSLVSAIDVHHTLLYIAGSNVVQVMDISDPVSPKQVISLTSGMPAIQAMAVHNNYLYYGHRLHGIKRMSLASSAYSIETIASSLTSAVRSIFAFDSLVVVTCVSTSTAISGRPMVTFHIDPVTLETTFASNETSRGAIMLSSSYLVSLKSLDASVMSLRLDDVSDKRQPRLVYQLPSVQFDGDSTQRLVWDGNNIVTPSYWSLSVNSEFASYVPQMQAAYSQAFPKPLGYFKQPLQVSGALDIKADKGAHVVLTSSIIKVSDASRPPAFLKTTILLQPATSTRSSIQILSTAGAWTDLKVGEGFESSLIDEGKVRVTIDGSGNITFSARQLGIAISPINLVIQQTPLKSTNDSSKALKNGFIAFFAVLGSCIAVLVGLVVFIRYYRLRGAKKSAADPFSAGPKLVGEANTKVDSVSE